VPVAPSVPAAAPALVVPELPVVPVASMVPAVPVATAEAALKAQMIEELSKRTGMTAQYSELCLSGSANWNFDLALRSFEELRANLPAIAFIQPI